jgi:hypothetical protein
MNHSTTLTAELDQIEDLYEVSDEAVEAAAPSDLAASPSSLDGGIRVFKEGDAHEIDIDQPIGDGSRRTSPNCPSLLTKTD